ncbi:M14 family zinc carboxypeptidase [Streptomyces sp. JJ36]|uniref:M14 family zinc carboxypeptidase n=1 Tax=Streptomyces sp. JJ36 TaxID=2736645 RepID=UPI001F462C64|nr:M14 family zinc carboxypeptidase [Streptomyces sp. JJ36]MCF6525895.1 3-hydroxyacyl-CoA dehydrogenase [Streptomyces sp. JJ36]
MPSSSAAEPSGPRTGPTGHRPSFHPYPSLHELYAAARALADRHPGHCALRPVGRSRQGTELLLLSVTPDAQAPPAAAAARHVLVVAGPHANERVGGATVLHLAERALRDPALRARQDAGWHFLLCLDPDGTRLNENAVPHPPTVLDGHRVFFRPTGTEQPEWAPSLGTSGNRLPESRALENVVEEIRPFLQCSLHGHDVGGAWVQSTRHIPGLTEPFMKSTADLGIPVEISNIDTLYWKSAGPGVFVLPEFGPGAATPPATLFEDVPRSTWYYPHRHGGTTLVVEAPMWMSWSVGDGTPVPDPRHTVAVRAGRLRGRGLRVAALLDGARPLVPPGHPADALLRGAEAAAGVCPPMADEWMRLSAEPAGWPVAPLTAGQAASLDAVTWRIPLRAAAMVHTALDGVPGREAAGLRDELDRLVRRWSGAFEEEFEARWVPVDDQVRHQARMVVAGFELLV